MEGHLQVLLNMHVFGMDPQTALDAPRFCISPSEDGRPPIVCLERGISETVKTELEDMGYYVELVTGMARGGTFGRGQVIKCKLDKNSPTGRIYSAGSDQRGMCLDGFNIVADSIRRWSSYFILWLNL